MNTTAASEQQQRQGGAERHALTLKSLSIGYKSGGVTKTVASGITSTVEAHRLTCLIGPNGVGKSTLLRTIAGFQPPLSGSVYIKDKDIALYSGRELARLVSVVLTTKPDAMNMTVREIVSLGRTPYTGFWGTLSNADKAVVDESIATVGISHLSHRMIRTLSDGERQKMMIAKALAQQTPIIVLDEPTAYLDYPSKVETIQLLLRLTREEKKTIFMSTHDLELTLQIADTLWLMNGGGVCVGTPRDLSASGALSSFIERPGIRFDSDAMRVEFC